MHIADKKKIHRIYNILFEGEFVSQSVIIIIIFELVKLQYVLIRVVYIPTIRIMVMGLLLANY